MAIATPPLPVAKARYLRVGMESVEGWLDASTATYLSSIEVLQRKTGIDGDVCEIGVHHGKSFLCLALGLPKGQRAVAIDVFDDQALNEDGSGHGDRAIFEENLAKHGANGNVVIIRASSLELERRGFVAEGRRYRLFSIHGGHTVQLTVNDLRTAEQTIVPRGVTVLDDLLNPHWLGVVTGLFRYWSEGGRLVPSVVLPNKLLLVADVEVAEAYRELLGGHFYAARTKRAVPLGEHHVDVYGDFPWVVTDDAGLTGLLAGRGNVSKASAGHTRVVPADYIADLEGRVKDLERRVKESPPLPRRIARKFPPAVWLYRRIKGLPAGRR